jgi:hypothetical protein
MDSLQLPDLTLELHHGPESEGEPQGAGLPHRGCDQFAPNLGLMRRRAALTGLVLERIEPALIEALRLGALRAGIGIPCAPSRLARRQAGLFEQGADDFCPMPRAGGVVRERASLRMAASSVALTRRR